MSCLQYAPSPLRESGGAWTCVWLRRDMRVRVRVCRWVHVRMEGADTGELLTPLLKPLLQTSQAGRYLEQHARLSQVQASGDASSTCSESSTRLGASGMYGF